MTDFNLGPGRDDLVSLTQVDGQMAFSGKAPRKWGVEEWIGIAAGLINHCARNAGVEPMAFYEDVDDYVEPMRDILVDHGKGN